MAANSSVVCAACGTVNPPGSRWCGRCGRPLSAAAPTYAVGAVYAVPIPVAGVSKEEDRTLTGLMLLIIGFLLDWIPYVSILGSLLILIGALLVFLGRHAFSSAHARNAAIGAVLILIVLLSSFGLTIWFVGAVLGQAAQASTNLASISAALQSEFAALLIGAAVLGVLNELGFVILVYSLADRTSRIMLWAALLAGTVIAATTGAILVPQVVTAVGQATSGSTFDAGPITQLQATATLFGIANIVPNLLFAWAYYRCRTQLTRGASSAPLASM